MHAVVKALMAGAIAVSFSNALHAQDAPTPAELAKTQAMMKIATGVITLGRADKDPLMLVVGARILRSMGAGLAGRPPPRRSAAAELVEGGDGRDIGDAVDQRRAEVALEGTHHRRRLLVENRFRAKAIAVCAESLLEVCHCLPPSPGWSAGPATTTSGMTQWPMPAAASSPHGNSSPGSSLRAGATSECASTRCGGIAWRVRMSRQSATTAATCAGGKPR